MLCFSSPSLPDAPHPTLTQPPSRPFAVGEHRRRGHAGAISRHGRPVPTEFPPALQLLNYFQTAGLVVEDPRDNTAKGWCDAAMWDCTEFLTSEQVSIAIRPSPEGAERLMSTGSAYVSSDGRVGLSFAAQRTPIEQQDQFTRALEDHLLTVPAQG